MADTPVIYNDFLEHALVSKFDEYGHEIYACRYPWTTKFYYKSREAEKEFIDIDEEIYEEDIPGFCQDLRAAGITEFTYSYEYSANQSIAKVFEDNGFILTKVHYYPMKELEWFVLDNGKPTEDMTQIPEVNDIILPAYYFSTET